MFLLFLLALLVGLPTPSIAQTTYQVPAPELARLVDVPPTPGLLLSPDRTFFLVTQQPDLPSIEELAQPELRLAGLRINPRIGGPSRANALTGLGIMAATGGEVLPITGLPANPKLRNLAWNADGSMVAFTHDAEDRIVLYVLDTRTREARPLSLPPLANVLGNPITWMTDLNTLLVRVRPNTPPALPTANAAPVGPVIQENERGAAPARTFQDLLTSPADEQTFDHYATSRLYRVDVRTGASVNLLSDRVLASAMPSPDDRYVIVTAVTRPYSYLVPVARFARTIEVIDAQTGVMVHTVARLPVQENVPTGFGSTTTGPRNVMWRADAPSTLVWVEAQDGGNGRVQMEIRDHVLALTAPFSGTPVVMSQLPYRFAGIQWHSDDLALITESWMATRQVRTWIVAPSQLSREKTLLFDYSSEDGYNLPGNPVMRTNAAGYGVLHLHEGNLLLTGTGASPEGDRPFLRRFNLETREMVELFRSAAPYYEAVTAVLDDVGRRFVTLRESQTEVPNFFVRDLGSESLEPLTNFPHPYPELRDLSRELITYTREDGVALSATLYLPLGYDAQRAGPLPTLVWAYPREFKSVDAAGQISGSPHRFARVSYWGPVPYVLRGYAILDNAAIPILGEGDEEPNDTFVEQLVAGAEAAIQEGVRRGVVDASRVAVGGHSYGAFMTANLLAHSRLFRAGIARSGAYNRTLTPFGFQFEERTYWEAPDVYNRMSPFQNAHLIEAPMLLIHGEADNNAGTFPIQSERLYNALRGLGTPSRLVMLPHESHGYVARESLLHMVWETDRWLERHVKPVVSSPESR